MTGCCADCLRLRRADCRLRTCHPRGRRRARRPSRTPTSDPQPESLRGTGALPRESRFLRNSTSLLGASTARASVISHNVVPTRAAASRSRPHLSAARDALMRLQNAQGFWLFELEADCNDPGRVHHDDALPGEIDFALKRRSRSICDRDRPSMEGGRCITAASWI